MYLGLITLILASITAMRERDGKKIVALSTLRQLGIIVTALALGSKIIVYNHILTHAFAKANLFLVVGSYLHRAYSEQNARKLWLRSNSLFLSLAGIVSVLRLRGLLFVRGFFSKEQILIRRYFLNNRIGIPILLFRVATLTMSYSIKLNRLIISNKSSIESLTDLAVISSVTRLTLLTLTSGLFLSRMTLLVIFQKNSTI